jgi:hypothetical protein
LRPFSIFVVTKELFIVEVFAQKFIALSANLQGLLRNLQMHRQIVHTNSVLLLSPFCFCCKKLDFIGFL